MKKFRESNSIKIKDIKRKQQRKRINRKKIKSLPCNSMKPVITEEMAFLFSFFFSFLFSYIIVTNFLINNTGLRYVEPYYFTFEVDSKERWEGKELLDVFSKEFSQLPRQTYVIINFLLSYSLLFSPYSLLFKFTFLFSFSCVLSFFFLIFSSLVY